MAPGDEATAGQAHGGSRRMVLTGRLAKRENGVCQIELVEGLTVDIPEEDCSHIEEKTDPTTLRSVVMVELREDKPITATFQPHLYRVLSQAGSMPFAFGGQAQVPPEAFAVPSIMARPVGGGLGGGFGGFQDSIGETQSRSQYWTGGWGNDDTQIDHTDDSVRF